MVYLLLTWVSGMCFSSLICLMSSSTRSVWSSSLSTWFVEMTDEAVGVETGVDPFLFAGGKEFGNESRLQHGFTAGRCHATAGGIHEVAIAGDVTHQLRYGHFAATFGIGYRGCGSTCSASGSLA